MNTIDPGRPRGAHTIGAQIVAVLAAAAMVALGWPAAVASAEGEPALTLSGVVTDAATSQPLGGVLVEDLVDGEATGSATTAVDGTYTLPVAAGDHQVRAAVSGYAPGYFETEDGDGNPTQVVTVADVPLTGIDIALDQYGAVAGTVTASSGGAAVAGVRVKFFEASSDSPNPVASTLTGADGSYLEDELLPGRYLIQFDASDTAYRSLWWDGAAIRDDATAVDVSAGGHALGRNASLVEGSRISGTVTDPDGAPVSGAWVCPSGNWAGSPGCATADSSGNYLLKGLYPGQYSLYASAPGYVTTYFGDVANSSAADSFSVPESASVSGKDIRMLPGTTISGTVRDSAGSPVSGATVCVSGHGCDWTGSDGTYTVGTLPLGSYSLYARATGTATVWSNVVQITSLDPVTGVDFTLDPGADASISGTASLSDGDTTTLVTIVASSSSGSRSVSVPGGSSYSFTDLPAGNYTLRFRAPGYTPQCYGGDACTTLTLATGEQLGGIDVVLASADSVTLTGSVVDPDGSPLAGATVMACADSCASAISDDTGAFVLLVPGGGYTWWVTVSLADRSSWNWYGTLSADRDLGTITLSGTGSLSGTVYADALGSTPLAGASVSLYPDSGYYASYTVQTDSAGRYAFTGVAAGFYVIRASKSSSDAAWAFYPSARSANTATVVTVGAGKSLTGYDMALAKWGSISGKVVDGTGEPVKGAVVTARERDDDASDQQVTTGSDGTFTLGLLAPGSYAISAGELATNGYVTVWWGGSSEADAARITVTPASATSGVTLQLARPEAGTLSGTVREADGTPAGGVDVYIGSDEYWQWTSTDDAGRYTFDEVPVGSYEVQVSTGRVESWWYPGVPSESDAEVVPVTAGQVVSVDIELPAIGTITGHVSGPDGADATNVWLSLLDADGERVASCWIGVDDDDSDCGASGSDFTLSAPVGDYELEVGSDEFLPWSRTVTVSAAGTALDVELAAGSSIGGTVSGDLGGGNVMVYVLVAGTGERAGRTWIDSDTGAYRVGMLPAGDYLVVAVDRTNDRALWYGGETARTATVLALGEASDLDAVDFEFPACDACGTGGGGEEDGTVLLSGTVRFPDGMTPTAEDFGSLWGQVYYGDDEDYPVEIAADGAFSLRVPEGTYEFYLDGPDDLNIIAYDEQVVVAGDTVHDIALAAGGALTGRVLDPTGRGVSARVEISYPADAADDSYAVVYTDEDGTWTAGGLPAGGVTVMVDPYNDTFTSRAVGDGATYQVVAGETVGTPTVTLGLAGRIAGRILRGSGEDTYRYVEVTVLSSDGRELATSYASAGHSYVVRGVPAGDVLVAFSADGMATQWWRGATTLADATPVTVRAGEATRGITPDLPASTGSSPDADNGTISGSVSSEVGFGATISVHASGDAGHDTVTVRADGTYALLLPPGRYRVVASLCVGLWMGRSGCMGEKRQLWYPSAAAEDDGQWVEVIANHDSGGIDLRFTDALPFDHAPKPVITGEARVGQTLTATIQGWEPQPDQLSYQWLRNGAAIEGATGESYEVQSADIGSPLGVTVTASSTGRVTTSTTSEFTAAVVDSRIVGSVPGIAGTPKLGATLTADAGAWVPAPDTLGYQWLRDGVAIDGATQDVYTLVAADVGTRMSVTVTGTKAGYEPVSLTSVETGRVAAGELTGARPRIDGNAVVGSVLTAEPGTWGPAPVDLAYQWLRDGVAIDGATAAGHEVDTADVGARLSVTVTGTSPGYDPLVLTSAETAVVPGLELTRTPTPTVSGTAKVGATLTAKPGDWAPAPVTLAYQWLRSGAPIAGADQATYTLVGADAGSTIAVTVTGSREGYGSASMTSDATGTVAQGALTSTPVPVLDPTRPVVDQVVTASEVTWGPGEVTLGYQWYKVSAKGKSTLLKGETARSHVVSAAEVGYRLKAKVTGTATGYAARKVYTAMTAKVRKAAFAAVAPPTIEVDGTPRVGKSLTAVPGAGDPSATSWTYRWYRVSAKGTASAIKGATRVVYVLTAADLGRTLKVRVTSVRSGYTSSVDYSVPTASVEAGLMAKKPKLSTTRPTVGQELAVTTATGVDQWAPQPVTATYQWFRDRKQIAGATAATYVVTADDLGRAITVRVTGSAADYADVSRTSAATDDVRKGAFVTRGTVAIVADGDLLTADEGTWSPAPDRYGYQWYRDGAKISGATGRTYDRGGRTGAFVVKVTAIRAGYASASVRSAPFSA